MKTTWFDEEPRFGDFIRQTAELIVRGIRRPWLTLFVALLAAGLVSWRARVRQALVRAAAGTATGGGRGGPRPRREA